MTTSIWAPAVSLAALLALSACAGEKAADAPESAPEAESAAEADAPASESPEATTETAVSGLAATVEARSDEDKARDQYRHPLETLEFFGIEPSMSVAEVLPGGGWYSRVLIPFVNEGGRYVAINYHHEMFPLVIANLSDERKAEFKAWPQTFPVQAAEWGATGEVGAYEFGEIPQNEAEQLDAVLMIRSLHNFNRAGGDYMTNALADAFAVLKPGGVLGVVQHSAPEGAEGENTDGTFGYMSKDLVVSLVTAAGFVLEAESDVNVNLADKPADGEFVWRLPPSYALGDKNKEAYTAIGETNRMTLRFRKPAE